MAQNSSSKSSDDKSEKTEKTENGNDVKNQHKSKTSSSKPFNSTVKDNATQRRDKPKDAVQTRIVIRHLPPSMTAEQFLSEVSPVPEYNDFYLIKADASLGQFSFSRAYFNFVHIEDIYIFKDKFDNYVFLDTKGNEYPAIVEFAPFQKTPRRRIGPNGQPITAKKRDNKCATIEQDTEYIAFLEELERDKHIANLPSAEVYLEEIEAKEKELKANHGVLKMTTPLIEYIKQRKADKLRQREERRDERRKVKVEQQEMKRAKEEEHKRRMREKQIQLDKKREEIKRRIKTEQISKDKDKDTDRPVAMSKDKDAKDKDKDTDSPIGHEKDVDRAVGHHRDKDSDRIFRYKDKDADRGFGHKDKDVNRAVGHQKDKDSDRVFRHKEKDADRGFGYKDKDKYRDSYRDAYKDRDSYKSQYKSKKTETIKKSDKSNADSASKSETNEPTFVVKVLQNPNKETEKLTDDKNNETDKSYGNENAAADRQNEPDNSQSDTNESKGAKSYNRSDSDRERVRNKDRPAREIYKPRVRNDTRQENTSKGSSSQSSGKYSSSSRSEHGSHGSGSYRNTRIFTRSKHADS